MKFEEVKDKDTDYTSDISSDVAYKEAKEKGLKVVLPDEFTLQIDIDNEASFSVFKDKIEYLARWYDFEYKVNISFSGKPHRHIYVTMLIPITPLERIFLQLFLGSDPTREFSSFRRIKENDLHPTLFLEKKT